MAVASLHTGTRNVRPQASALICCHTALRAPPPSEYTVSAGQPRAFSMPKKSRSRNATDSITLRAKWARVVESRAPKNTARASGQASGSTLPDKNGRNASPSHPQGTLCTSASSAAYPAAPAGRSRQNSSRNQRNAMPAVLPMGRYRYLPGNAWR